MNPAENPDGLAIIPQLHADCMRLKGMIAGLASGSGRVADKTHEIRKLGKTLRGGCFLTKTGKHAARDLAGMARMLAAPRDAVTCLNAWNQLAVPGTSREFQLIGDLLVFQTKVSARKPPASCIDWCCERIDALGGQLLAVAGHGGGKYRLRMARKLRKRVHQSTKRLADGHSYGFHDCRKDCKAWLGAAHYLGIPDHETAECREFSQILGDENDLASLEDWLEDHGFSKHGDHPWWDLIASRRSELQESCREAARTLLKAWKHQETPGKRVIP